MMCLNNLINSAAEHVQACAKHDWYTDIVSESILQLQVLNSFPSNCVLDFNISYLFTSKYFTGNLQVIENGFHSR